ncbi:precorrin-6y C5,15-methyltransferase (decarboxylating) subunit CbiE [Denitromonas ohlonensis]|uniref:Precorrin-6y C5,15-methyltransferase (Decarboxylating) subunit CbiE n=2 Tax=Denitromonas TaxID=139331 RepID=A0A557RP41_9RHOO|nr:precorrin-6y C5,15-methyltransferase (decarboxylating) subunit CbiE [Denitromonas ohlonensis]TVO66865.1 precorrin-6y C5,15-methyltransferase (decarboxylating) subunit CbiE [Denitromonas ohlonensis]TVO79735.1 precorrin-6y C5,15-methyltransferase (decarboxylating) subunit CbiE [Denitromonas ohlonensis]
MSEHCTLIGILDDGWAGLSDTARQRLATAGLVIGAGRTLALLERHLSGTASVRPMDGALGKVPEWIAQAHADGLSTVVLATGDPLCHGMASFLVRKLGAAAVAVLPAPSTLQLLFARLKKPWQDVVIGSVHSKDAGEWMAGATPDHGLYRLVRQVAEHPRVAAFTGPENSPDRIARALLAAGFEDARISVASRLCLPDEAVFADLALAEAAAMRFDDPNVVLIERDSNAGRSVFGFDDLDYVQRSPEKGLITKLEARAVSLARLGLRADSMVWDIGAGSGSVGLEASRVARHGHVWAIEKNEADAANARENARRFGASNYTLVQAKAPEQLATWPDPDAVFIGGSGGELAALIALILTRLKPGGRLVMNFVTIENLATATAALTAAGARWDVTQLSAARSQPILEMHRLAAQNPVWIVTAHKESA